MGEAATTISAGHGAHAGGGGDPSDLAATRDLFWQNIVREMLTGLAVLADQRRSEILAAMHASLGQVRVGGALITTSPELAPTVVEGSGGADRAADGDGEEDENGEGGMLAGAHPSLPLDGRVAVLTRGGERIPIADVRPMLACSVPGTDAERALSIDVQCTIFQIVAPSGEVFTLPLQEIRALHAISEELMDRLKSAARRQDEGAGRSGDDPDSKPFGFAAFTSLAQRRRGR